MHAYNDLLWAVFGWTTAGRVIIYGKGKSECKVNTNVFIFIYYYPPQSTAAAQVCNGIRSSVNYVIAGVNSKDSVQMCCKLLADV